MAHDSHNIIAVGCTDEDLEKAINTLIDNKGGISVYDRNSSDSIPLEVAGLMSAKNGEELAIDYERLFDKSNAMGSTLFDPFMMLSFCALLVIPELKLSDKGLFNANTFNFVPLKKKTNKLKF